MIWTRPFSVEHYLPIFGRLNASPYCSENVLKRTLSKMIIKSKLIKVDSPPSAIIDSIGIQRYVSMK